MSAITIDPNKFVPDKKGQGITIDPKKFVPDQKPSLTWTETGKEALGNLVPSTIKMGEEMVAPILHPIETVKGLGKAGSSPENFAKTLWDDLKKKYGSEEAIKESIAKDPASVMADLSILLAPLSAARKIGPVARMTDPTRLLAKIPPSVAKGAKKAVSHGVGYTTGAGPWAVEKALEGAKPFKEGLKGRGESSIIDAGRNAVGSLNTQMGNEYKQRLEEILSRTAPMGTGEHLSLHPPLLDLSPFHQTLHETLRDFGITKNPATHEWDFSKSSILPSEQSNVRHILDLASGYGSKAEERGIPELDAFKRHLADLRASEGPSSALAGRLHKSVRDILEKNVPGYKEMTRNYAEKKGRIREIEKALSLGHTGTTDTAMRKLLTGVRELPDFRRQMIEELDRLNPGFADRLAGYMMKEWAPRSLGASRMFGGELGAGSLALLLHHPEYAIPALGMAATSSPKLMGTLLYHLGREARRVRLMRALEAAGKLPPQAYYRLGQIERSGQNSKKERR